MEHAHTHTHTHIQHCDLIRLPSFQKRQEDNKAEAWKSKLYFCSLQYQKWQKFYIETEKDGDTNGNSIGNLGNGVETPAARADQPTNLRDYGKGCRLLLGSQQRRSTAGRRYISPLRLSA